MYALVLQFGNREAAAWESDQLLERIFAEQCEVTDDPGEPVAIRPPRQRARRLHNASDEFRDRDRWRAGVEATLSRYKHQMGIAHLRIRGRQKVTFTALLRALSLNIHRVAVWKRAMATA